MPEFDSISQLDVSGKTDSESFRDSVLQDFWICCVSRYVSLMGRREVLTGKAKFGILGDGKEVPQVALARAVRKGDWRAGYYRDQTLMFALGLATVEEYFAQLYADSERDPWSGGRQMNAHFATRTIDDSGDWLSQLQGFNVSSDISPTGGQMARSLGLALASQYYRQSKDESLQSGFSRNGDEICICTIGDASTSEGIFWETMNAAAVMKVPLAVSVWDDGYGISVPKELQTVKASISTAMAGMRSDDAGPGIDIYTCHAWDYPGLCAMYERGLERVRERHIPALFHIEECTQPQGHSTSGSHERYKSKERLEWEEHKDCIIQMEYWMVDNGLASSEELQDIRERARDYVKSARMKAWKAFIQPVEVKRQELRQILLDLAGRVAKPEGLQEAVKELDEHLEPVLSEVVAVGRKAYFSVMHQVPESEYRKLGIFIQTQTEIGRSRYDSQLYSPGEKSALTVPVVPPVIDDAKKPVNGYQVLNAFFDKVLARDDRVLAFGEDVGRIGDVNQGFAGLQEKYGELRVFDTGIREWSIMGQAIGLAMRGLRPIAEIQYLDYLIYGLPALSDDLATLRYRSNGIQHAPAIVRTRGHRLEGIWHSGSPLGMVIHALRGMYVCVPRNMVQAAGMYNTLLQSDDPALVIECLNGYRKKELLPDNIGEYTVPLGVPEILTRGFDLTLVSYGSVLHEIMEAVSILDQLDISVEVIDVQTLLPFDLEGVIVNSIRKTNKVLFVDEDVPGGASAYMMQEVLENQGAFQYLDSEPTTVTAGAHRPPYGSDGDYFSKPVCGDIVQAVYRIMRESAPDHYPVSIPW